MIVSELLNQVGQTLLDEENDRWTLEELLDYYNAALREIVFLKPEANTKTAAHKLVAGIEQALPVDGLALKQVVCNMGTAGTVVGKATRLVDFDALTNADPNWTLGTASVDISNYTYDRENPLVFYCEPPATGTGYVKIIYFASPPLTTIANIDSDSVPISTHYLNPLSDAILYRAFMKDSDVPASQANRDTYRGAFYSAMGIKEQAEVRVDPTRNTSPPIEVI